MVNFEIKLIAQKNEFFININLLKGFATDQGSNFVKCFKPAIIPGADYSASENEDDSLNNTLEDQIDLDETAEEAPYFLKSQSVAI